MSPEPETSYRPSSAILERRALARRRAAIQRRRLAAAIAGCVLFVLAIAGMVALLSGGGSSRATTAGIPAGTARGAPAPHAKALDRDENAAVDHVLAYTPFISRGGSRKHEVALTFDDGPGPFTTQVVKVLRHFHAPATFFQVGVMIPVFRGPGREVRRFFPVGDHTLSHAMLGRLPRGAQQQEIIGDEARLRLEGVSTPRLFRPPYASFNSDTIAVLKPLRMLMVLWSVDSRDYTRPGTKAVIYNVLSGVRPGAIVLMHDAGGDRSQTVAALPTIIRKLRKRHFKLVTVPQLLHDAPPPHDQELPPSGEGIALTPPHAAARHH